MTRLSLTALALVLLSTSSFAAPAYRAVPSWLKPAPGMETIGNAHGDVAVASNGDVYVSVAGAKPGLQVFSADGTYLRNVPGAPPDFHGFVIHQEPAGEFIYGARLFGQTILKMTLEGEVVLEIKPDQISDDMKIVWQGRRRLLLTGMDVGPDGTIYAVDGYATDRIHIYSAEGVYQRSIAGKQAPYGFKTNHKIAVDTRFDPVRLLCTDRENRRMISLSLEGEVMQVIDTDIRRPAAVAVHGDYAAVAEIEGRVSLLDKAGNTVLTLGANEVEEQTATNLVPPAQWRTGILTAPHGIAFGPNGDLLAAEFNQYGRVVRYNLKAN